MACSCAGLERGRKVPKLVVERCVRERGNGAKGGGQKRCRNLGAAGVKDMCYCALGQSRSDSWRIAWGSVRAVSVVEDGADSAVERLDLIDTAAAGEHAQLASREAHALDAQPKLVRLLIHRRE
eukprot:723241-Pleurochrysis_carterae.AAC.2